MNINEIKNISIPSYLQSIGCEMRADRGRYGMYLSPLRRDSHPSLKVDYNKNLWYDFGTGEGGSIIDLVMRLESCSFNQAVGALSETRSFKNSFSFHCNNQSEGKSKSSLQVISVSPIKSKSLIQYLRSRNIPLEIATEYCSEVHFEVGNKRYYSIGFPNDSGGYVLRNKYCQQCTSSDITTFSFPEKNYDSCLVFEGFFDFLSYVVLQDIKKIKSNLVILNSVNNLNKSMEFLQKQDSVITFMDNDNAGRKATSIVQEHCISVIDRSQIYSAFNDLNEFLIHQRSGQIK